MAASTANRPTAIQLSPAHQGNHLIIRPLPIFICLRSLDIVGALILGS